MRYVIKFDKMINQLVPHYIGGRKLILYLQSLISPLQVINDEFTEYAKEKRIEATVTSQIIIFQWYLTRKLKKYFKSNGSVVIYNETSTGIPLYHEGATGSNIQDNMLLYRENENQKNTALYQIGEKTQRTEFSFMVGVPDFDPKLISEEQYKAMVRFYVNQYRIAGKTFSIKINKQ